MFERGKAIMAELLSDSGPSLTHYASKYYDPVKARQYYLRTRELQGRQAAKPQTQGQREATSYVRNEINTRKKAELDANQKAGKKLSTTRSSQVEAHRARMVKIQKLAVEAQQRIEEKLAKHLERIETQLKIPENASPKLRAYLEKQKAEQTKSATAASRSERQALHRNLRGAIDSARSEYRALSEAYSTARQKNSTDRRSIVKKYKTDLETETKNIKDNVR